MLNIDTTNNVDIVINAQSHQGFITTLTIRKKLIIYIDNQLLDGSDYFIDYR